MHVHYVALAAITESYGASRHIFVHLITRIIAYTSTRLGRMLMLESNLVLRDQVTYEIANHTTCIYRPLLVQIPLAHLYPGMLLACFDCCNHPIVANSSAFNFLVATHLVSFIEFFVSFLPSFVTSMQRQGAHVPGIKTGTQPRESVLPYTRAGDGACDHMRGRAWTLRLCACGFVD